MTFEKKGLCVMVFRIFSKRKQQEFLLKNTIPLFHIIVVHCDIFQHFFILLLLLLTSKTRCVATSK